MEFKERTICKPARSLVLLRFRWVWDFPQEHMELCSQAMVQRLWHLTDHGSMNGLIIIKLLHAKQKK